MTRFRTLLFLDCLKTQTELTQMLSREDDVTTELSVNVSDSITTIIDKHYDIIITDFCDQETNVSETIAQFKQASQNTALILLTHQSSPLAEIDYLNQGADCVITKPLNPSLTMARIRALIRWRHIYNSYSVKVGPFEFNKETKSLVRPNLPNIKLTEKEAQVLQYLLLQKGKIVSRSDLLHHVWGYNDDAHTHTVETHIYRLRKKLGTVLNDKPFISTEVGGYRMVLE